jgi:hypothetical protein
MHTVFDYYNYCSQTFFDILESKFNFIFDQEYKRKCLEAAGSIFEPDFSRLKLTSIKQEMNLSKSVWQKLRQSQKGYDEKLLDYEINKLFLRTL